MPIRFILGIIIGIVIGASIALMLASNSGDAKHQQS